MAASDLPDEACGELIDDDHQWPCVRPAGHVMHNDGHGRTWTLDVVEQAIRVVGRAQVLAEVDAALRDRPRFDAWIMQTNRWDADTPIGTTADFEAADYVRDTLGAGGDGEG